MIQIKLVMIAFHPKRTLAKVRFDLLKSFSSKPNSRPPATNWLATGLRGLSALCPVWLL